MDPADLQQGHSVCAETEEKRVAEGNQPGAPENQEPDGDAAARHRLQPDRAHPFLEPEIEGEQGYEAEGQAPEGLVQQTVHIFLAVTGAKSPWGRMIRTMAIIA